MKMEEQRYEIPFDNYERKNFMYNSFLGNKSVNPKHWDSKINFWTKEIIRCCRFYNDACITSEKLSERFSQNDVGKPKGKVFSEFNTLYYNNYKQYFCVWYKMVPSNQSLRYAQLHFILLLEYSHHG